MAHPDFELTDVATLNFATIATWTNIVPADFTSSVSGAAVTAGYYSSLAITNTSGAGTVYMACRPLTNEATTNEIAIAAGATLSLPIWGANVQTLSFIGSAEGLTVSVLAFFLPYKA